MTHLSIKNKEIHILKILMKALKKIIKKMIIKNHLKEKTEYKLKKAIITKKV